MVLAAARAGARGVGLDINPGLIRAANARAKTEQLDHLVQFQVASQEMFSVRDIYIYRYIYM